MRPSAQWKAPCPSSTSKTYPAAWSPLCPATAAGWVATWCLGHMTRTVWEPVRVDQLITPIRTGPAGASVVTRRAGPLLTTSTRHGALAPLCLHITETKQVISQRGSTSDHLLIDTACPWTHRLRAALPTPTRGARPRACRTTRGTI